MLVQNLYKKYFFINRPGSVIHIVCRAVNIFKTVEHKSPNNFITIHMKAFQIMKAFKGKIKLK